MRFELFKGKKEGDDKNRRLEESMDDEAKACLEEVREETAGMDAEEVGTLLFEVSRELDPLMPQVGANYIVDEPSYEERVRSGEAFVEVPGELKQGVEVSTELLESIAEKKRRQKALIIVLREKQEKRAA